MVWSHKNSIFKSQRKLYEKFNLWSYGLQIEMSSNELHELVKDKFIILNHKIVSCVGDKGIWTLIDSLNNKIIKDNGRYIFLHLKKQSN